MPVITVEMWEGRTAEQKRNLVKGITRATADAIQCAPEAVTIILKDIPKSNWAEGGTLASEKS